MPLPIDVIKKLIIESIPDASIEIKDLMGDNNHYAATIKSSRFNNLSKIEQHKLVYKSLPHTPPSEPCTLPEQNS